MDTVFVVGLAIEVAGAALLAAGQIRLVDRTILTPRTSVLESGEPRREAQQESARFTVGVALLATGVIVQLVGYAVDGGWWLLGLAVGVISNVRRSPSRSTTILTVWPIFAPTRASE